MRRAAGGVSGWRVVAGVLAVGLLAGCGTRNVPIVKPPPPEVTIALPIVREVHNRDEYPGRIQATASVDIRARVSGYITKINFVDGQEVKAGDELLEIDPRPYKADNDVALAKIDQTTAALAFGEKEVARYTELRKKGAGTQEDLDRAISSRDQAKADLALAKAQAEQTKLNLDWTTVTAPVAGRVSRHYVDLGNLVNGSPGTATLLTTLVTEDPADVYFDVDERSMQRYLADAYKRTGQRRDLGKIAEVKIPVSVGLAGDVGFPHTGYIDFVDNTSNVQSGTVKVRAVLPNPDRNLIPGFFARVQVRSGTPYEAVLVAERTIAAQQSMRFVMVVDDENVVRAREVELGRLFDGMRVITQGLKPDEWIIVDGLQRARPGETVNPHKESMPQPLVKTPATNGTSSGEPSTPPPDKSPPPGESATDGGKTPAQPEKQP
ncbi:MAG TPA: efflux RND transporter periplasmic adaptor subunit [Planctomycetaceae bacterium]|nr:efflux RND transporter periplasmic adaptor subunit [Planctomycetaceae bacterium]